MAKKKTTRRQGTATGDRKEATAARGTRRRRPGSPIEHAHAALRAYCTAARVTDRQTAERLFRQAAGQDDYRTALLCCTSAMRRLCVADPDWLIILHGYGATDRLADLQAAANRLADDTNPNEGD